MNEPYLINFPKIGSLETGYLSICENEKLLFIPKRIYWTYLTPENIERGGHAHIELEQILVAVAGKIDLTIQTFDNKLFEFHLDQPNLGVYIPKKSWRKMKYSSNAVQMCIASLEYDEDDYIRDYEKFIQLSTK